MDILITLFPVILIGGLFFLWIAMLIHAITRPISNKALWIILLIFASIIGGVIYYFIIYRKVAKKRDIDLLKRIFITGGVALVVIGGITFSTLPLRNSNLQEVSFTKVIDYNVTGQIKRIELKGDELIVTLKGESRPTLRSNKPPGTSLQDHGIDPGEIELVIQPTR